MGADSTSYQTIGDPISPLDYRSSGDDKALFLGAVAGGIAGVLLLKLVFGISQVWVTALPVVIMLVYAWLTWHSERFRLRDDRAGDNIYYLGFLYTLASLGLALFQFSTESARAADIISNFGIALATTIVGLALRVLLNQMREDPAEHEGRSRVALSEATTKLRAELDASVTAIQSFQRTTLDAMDAAMQLSRKVSEDQMVLHAKAFGKQIAEVIIEFKAPVKELTDHATKINRATSKVAQASERMCERFEAIRPPSDILDRKLEGMVGRLDSASQALEHTASTLDRSVQTAEALGLAVHGLTGEVQAAAGFADVLQRARSSLEQITKLTNDELKTHHTHLRELREAFQGDVEIVGALRRKAQEISHDSETVLSGIKGTVDAIDNAGRTLSARTEDVARTVQQLADLLMQAKSAADPLVQMQIASASIASELEHAATRLGHLEALAARMDELTTKLIESEERIAQASTERVRVATEMRFAFEAELATARKLREELERENSLSVQAVAKVGTTLRSLADSLVEGLNASH